MTDASAIVDYLKSNGLYEAIAAQAGVAKNQPNTTDVHQARAGGEGKARPKARAFDDVMAEGKRPADAFETGFRVTKVDEDQKRIWGWASVSQVGDDLVVDKQDDIIPIAELEKAAYEFMLFAREMSDMHKTVGVGRPFESLVFTPEKEKLGIVAKNDAGKSIYGWWTGWQVTSDELWKAIKAGNRPEFSIGGRSRSEEVAA